MTLPSRRAPASLLLGLLFLANCSSPAGPTGGVVASISVTPAGDTLVSLGQTRQLSAVAKDAAGTVITGKTFTWSSSGSGVATVNATGLVTAIANGQATVSASVDGKSGAAVVLVDQQVATVEITPGSPAPITTIGGTQQFSATARDGSGAGLTGLTFLWLSSNHAVATVDASGKATAVGPGTATITAAARGVPASAQLTVTQVATQLVITAQPSTFTEGRSMGNAVQVEIRDAGGALVSGARPIVTLAISDNPAAGTLNGTVSVNAVGGIASFPQLSIDRAGQAYKLSASSSGLTPAVSSAFNVMLDFRTVDVGNSANCGTTASGAIYCWGANANSQLGDGTTSDRLVPTRAVTPPGVPFTRITSGNPSIACALAGSGAPYCWGIGFIGQPLIGQSTIPLLVPSLRGSRSRRSPPIPPTPVERPRPGPSIAGAAMPTMPLATGR